jgi:glycosyltransferase involved in cell wall biosynthesis
MKVIHVITGLSSGGAENMLARIVKMTAEQGGIDSLVVSLQDEGALGREIEQAGVKIRCLCITNPVNLVRGFINLCRLIRAEKPDAVMSWLYHADLLALLACIFSGVGAKKLSWNIRCAYLDFRQYAPTMRMIVWALALLSPLPGRVAHNSDAGRTVHEKLGYRPRKWVYLPNGFDPVKWQPDSEVGAAKRAELGIDENARLVVMAGRADPAKDYAGFFEAIGILWDRPDTRFLCIGKDTDKLDAPEAIKEKVILLGERKDLPEIMKASDVFVLCSAFGEGFPNVVGEAMLSATPCIVTNVWNAHALFGDTGTVVPPRDPVALAQGIRNMLDLPPAALEKMGQKARAIIAKDYDLQASYRKYQALWKELANNCAS